MKLIAGLGNPGRKYQGTRHNVGYLVLAATARRFGNSPPKEKFHGEVMEVEIGGGRVLLLSPTTYMNLSGQSVAEAGNFYKIPPANLLVICDDLNLPLGKLRIRARGSSGGQKGLEDIIRCLGTEDFARLRMGIGSPPEHLDWADFVLSRFTAEEQCEVDRAVARAVEAVEVWIRQGIGPCMNQFNAESPESSPKNQKGRETDQLDAL
ncbi:MAG: aminoacyl-tRNA hydrolase [Pirellulales bacterium]|nr:aminoacyl-tRNA hydrolase [Pirellulales bacterium]